MRQLASWEKLRVLAPGILATTMTRGFSMATGLVTLALTARALGPEGRGMIAAAMTWMGLFATLGGLSLGPVTLHRAAKAKGTTWLSPVFGTAVVVTVVVSLVSWLVAAIMVVTSGGAAFGGTSVTILCVAFGALPFYIWELFGSSLLISIGKLAVYNRAQIIGRTLGLLALVCVLWLGGGNELVMATMSASQAIVSLTGVRELWRASSGAPRWDFSVAIGLIRDGLKLHLTTVGALLIVNANLLTVSQSLGSVAMGHFQLATQLIAIMMVLPQSAATALNARLAEVGPDRAWKTQRQLIFTISAIMSVASLVAALLAPFAIPRVTSPDFEPSVRIFQWLLIPMQGMVLSVVLAPQSMARGMFWTASICTALLGLLSLAVSVTLIPRYGINGAILATCVTQGVLALLNLGFFVWFDRTSRRALSETAAGSVPVESVRN